jgi:predicted Zn-dependent protease
VLVRDAHRTFWWATVASIPEGAIRACETEAAWGADRTDGAELAGHFCAAPSAGDGGVGGLQQRIDPKLERQADDASLRVLAAAGYDPKAALAIATRIGREGDGQGRESWDRERLDQLARLVAEAPAGGRSDTPEFRRLRRQLDAGRQQGQ